MTAGEPPHAGDEAAGLRDFVQKVKAEHKALLEETRERERQLYDTILWESKNPKAKAPRTYLFIFEGKDVVTGQVATDMDIVTEMTLDAAVEKFTQLQFVIRLKRELVRIRLIALVI